MVSLAWNWNGCGVLRSVSYNSFLTPCGGPVLFGGALPSGMLKDEAESFGVGTEG